MMLLPQTPLLQSSSRRLGSVDDVVKEGKRVRRRRKEDKRVRRRGKEGKIFLMLSLSVTSLIEVVMTLQER
jgi:hypothetical protein